EKEIHREGSSKVTRDHPGSQPRARPEVERLVHPEENEEQGDRYGLLRQPRGPSPPQAEARLKPPRGTTRQHEGTGHAEEIPEQKERQHDEAAVMHPYPHRREIS